MDYNGSIFYYCAYIMEQKKWHPEKVIPTTTTPSTQTTLTPLDDERISQLSQAARELVDKAISDGPEGMKAQMKIKWLGKDRGPKSALLLTRLWDLNKSTSANNQAIYQDLMNINQTIEDEFGNMLYDQRKVWWIIKLLSKLPFIGDKIHQWVIDQNSLDTFIAHVYATVDKWENILTTQQSELNAQISYLKEDFKALKEQYYLAECVTQEIKLRIEQFNDSWEITTELALQRDELSKNLLTPVMLKAQALLERAHVNLNTMLQLSTLKTTADTLTIALDKVREVTIHALQNTLIASTALGQQQQIQSGINKLNDVTNKAIKRTSEEIANQSVVVAQWVMKHTTDIQAQKEAMQKIKESVLKVSDIYREGLKTIESSNQELVQLIKDGEKLTTELDTMTKSD